jgi:hypothetical protein
MGKYALCEHCRALFKFHAVDLPDDKLKTGSKDDEEDKLISGQSDSV